jgi:hypothetical protein
MHLRSWLLSPCLLAVLACASDGSTSVSLGPLDSLSSPASIGSGEPELAVAEDGRVYLSWLEPDTGATHALRFASLSDTTWSAPRTIVTRDDFFVNWADFPTIVSLGGDHLAAHWLQKNGAGTYAYGVRIAQSFDGGASWSDPVVPHTDSSASEHGFVSLFPLGDSLGAIWLDGRTFATAREPGAAEMMLYFAPVSRQSAVGAERPIDRRICDCCQTSVALVDSRPLVAYRDRSPDEIRDIYVARLTDSGWTTGVPVHNDGWKIDACPVNGPALAAHGKRVAVAWFTAARDTARVYVAHSTDGGVTFGAPARVDDGQPAGRVDVVADGRGGAFVSWLEMTPEGGADVRLRHVGGDGTTGPARTVARTSGARASGFPRMVSTGEHLILAWTEAGTSARVRTARIPLEPSR